jgi:alkaline phosphatase
MVPRLTTVVFPAQTFPSWSPEEMPSQSTLLSSSKSRSQRVSTISLVSSWKTSSWQAVQKYNFTYYEDLFAQKAGAKTPVNVLAKSYRNVQLHKPGQYTVTFTYNDGQTTVAKWDVLPLSEKPKAKNAIVFIGDGMATSMIAAARLLAHKTINGRYQSKMKMDEAWVLKELSVDPLLIIRPGYGSQMTHSWATIT